MAPSVFRFVDRVSGLCPGQQLDLGPIYEPAVQAPMLLQSQSLVRVAEGLQHMLPCPTASLYREKRMGTP